MTDSKNINILLMPIAINADQVSSYRVKNLLGGMITANEISFHNIIINNDYVKKYYYESIIRYKSKLWYFPIFQVKYLYQILKNKKKYKNIIYFYGSITYLNYLPLIISRLFGFKIIFDITEDNSSNIYASSKLQKLKKLSYIILEKQLKILCTHLIVISDALYSKYSQFIDKRKITYMPISVNLDEIYSISDSWQRESNNFTIFYGGSIAKKNGYHILLEAFYNFRRSYRADLVLTGILSKDDEESFYKLLKMYNRQESINYLGKLSYQRYLWNLFNCDVACIPRLSNQYSNAGFPFKLGEILALSKPVMVSPVSDISYYLKDMFNAIFIDTTDPNDLTSKLIWIYNNRKKTVKIGINGRSVANKYFNSNSHQTIVKKLIYNL